MWRSRMFWRLFVAYSLLVTLSLGVLGWMLLRRVEEHLLEGLRQSLEVKSILVAELVRQPAKEDERQAQIQRLGADTGSRITLIAADGGVLADSAENPKNMDNHGERPEIQAAAANGVGTSTRFSDTVQQSMMYLAKRMDTGPVRFVRVALPLGTVRREIRWLRQVTATGAGLTLVIAVFVTWFLAHRLSSPLIELADAARDMAQGNYGRTALIESKDEIGTLAAAFNDMSQASADSITRMDQDRRQLREIFRGMVEGVVVIDGEQCVQFLNEAAGGFLGLSVENAAGRKLWQMIRHHQLAEIVDRILASEEPQKAELEWHNGEHRFYGVHGARLPGEPLRGAVLVIHDITDLRRLERVRRDFVANVSHELKTPLAAIQAMVETLLDGAMHDPEHGVKFLQHVRDNADRLYRLVQDLLSLGRIESGQEIMDLQSIPVAAAVETCMARHEHRAAAKEIRLELPAAPAAVNVLADEEALAEILDNLVDNAVKYTSPGGTVRLRWHGEGTEVVLEMEDTGVGIADKDLPRIFERFYRADKARSRELGGTGLGLSIVKHLVQALGGAIAAKSQIGVGTTFSLRLPAAPRIPG